MRILITGNSGFIGTNLSRHLNSNHTLYGLDITSGNKYVIETFSWEEFKYQLIPDVDIIIHLAGKAHDTKKKDDAQSYYDINTGLTQKIFDHFMVSKASKFIFFSSVKAAVDSIPCEILTEDVVPNPKGAYGESKILAEKYIQEKWPSQESGKSVYILRPCLIHGPGNNGNFKLLYNFVSKGIPWPLGSFENRRSFTSVDNLSFVIDGLISKNIESGIYHIADDEALSTNELISVICETLGRKGKILRLPKGLMNFVAKIGGALQLPLNSERLHKLTENYVVSNSKIKNALGVDSMPVSAKEGLQHTIQSFQK